MQSEKLAQGFTTVSTQDSNPGSLSRESDVLPLSNCALQSGWTHTFAWPWSRSSLIGWWGCFPGGYSPCGFSLPQPSSRPPVTHTRGLPRFTGWELNGPIITGHVVAATVTGVLAFHSQNNIYLNLIESMFSWCYYVKPTAVTKSVVWSVGL